MTDVKGPYKVVAKLRRGGAVDTYSIAVEQKNGSLKEYVPDAGDGQTARHVANLLNRRFQEVFESLEVNDESVDGADGEGVSDSGQ